ncbi:Hsp20/alpha crystallin family protein [Metabacillus litoralis]|uniref:Hsp20/alpha crystallin family protein n=1 Tax=Metabacillus litoralis TaxID=152268 RepID=UPI001CFD9B9D|nr:Hsp20/alpha crystallin family protein [Metabacillus litoralis]
MDFEKLKQWMEISKGYQNGEFWNAIFDQTNPEEMMKQFQGDQGNKNNQKKSGYSPNTDIYLTDTAVIVLIEIPGANKEEILLSVSGTKLTIRGSIKLMIMNGVTIQAERKYGEFQRVIELPEPVDSKDIHARFENGLLVVTYNRNYRQEERINIR